MPCYDPPPAYAGKERKSAERAASLLCLSISQRIDSRNVSVEELEWFAIHREIDAEIETTGYYGRRIDFAAAESALSDVRKAREMMLEMMSAKAAGDDAT